MKLKDLKNTDTLREYQDIIFTDNTRNFIRNRCFNEINSDVPLVNLYDRQREELAKYFYRLERDENRTMFHMTVTYKERDYIVKNDKYNRDFTKFYCFRFLPYIMKTKKFTKLEMKLLQPITYAFLEEHESKPKQTYIESLNLREVTYAERKHHHAIIASTSHSLDVLNSLCNRQVKSEFNFRQIESIMIKKCDSLRLNYTTKDFKFNFEDYLNFPKDLKHYKKTRLVGSKFNNYAKDLYQKSLNQHSRYINTPHKIIETMSQTMFRDRITKL